jgi:raffinose/stachyose/melibiose transport system permease protein
MTAASPAQATASRSAEHSRRTRRRAGLRILAFLAPALAVYGLFVLFPVVQAARFSLFKWNGLGPLTDFVGLKNYATALSSPIFITSVSNNLLVIFLSLTIQIPFSLALAVMLNRRFPGRAVFRLLFFLPHVLSEAVTGIVFSLMLRPDSLVDSGLKLVGAGGLIQDWLGDTTMVMITLFVIITWKYFGFHMILMLAGLQGIPHEIEEAALIDGADRRGVFRHITLPLLGPTIRVSVFLSIIGALQLFDVVWVMTGGGPLNASSTMAVGMFKAGFVAHQMGYGSALAVILFIFGLIVALLYQRFVLRRDTEGALTVYGG